MLHGFRRAGLIIGRFLEGEFVDRLGGCAVRQTRQGARQHQVDEARILAVAEAAPLGVILTLEDLGEIARLGEFGPGVEAEHAGAGSRDERCERRGGDIGHQAQRLDVVGMLGPLIVADQRAIGLAAGHTELILVDLLEELALVELDRTLQVA